MAVSIRQLHDVFVGEVSGVDITKPLSGEEVAAIEAGMDRYAVLVFHGQNITDEQQQAFSRNFGPLEDARGGNVTKPQDKRLAEGMNDVSNLGKSTGTSFTGDKAGNILNGRTLAEDVIDLELLVVTGGLEGNAVLTTDDVDANDVAFPGTFPYLAPAN